MPNVFKLKFNSTLKIFYKEKYLRFKCMIHGKNCLFNRTSLLTKRELNIYKKNVVSFNIVEKMQFHN